MMQLPFSRIYKLHFSPQRKYIKSLRNLLGFVPGNVNLYRMAFRHRSAAVMLKNGTKNSNERLEFSIEKSKLKLYYEVFECTKDIIGCISSGKFVGICTLVEGDRNIQPFGVFFRQVDHGILIVVLKRDYSPWAVHCHSGRCVSLGIWITGVSTAWQGCKQDEQ